MQNAHFSLSSPNQEITLRVQLTDKIYYAVDFRGASIMWYSPISMALGEGKVLGSHPELNAHRKTEVNSSIKTVWGIRKEIQEQYAELTLDFTEKYSLIFRAYNDGVAYRFRTHFEEPIRIVHEEVAFRFLENHQLLAHVVGDFQTSFEKLYTSYKINEVVEAEFSSLPLLVDQGKVKLAISESDVYDYPGLYLKRRGNNNRFDIEGLFPEYPKKWEPGGLCHFNMRVTEREDYIAETAGSREFPWRLLVIAAEDKELADNDLVFKLARPNKLTETDWIKPGKVAWDWWNNWNLTGVDFETGVNNKTYEYYIDFAARNQLEYVILDEGWSDVFDLFLQKPGVDVPYLVEYARKKGIGIMLWVVWHTIDRQMIPALDLFEKWGVIGIKVDFIDRDDQVAMQFQERLALESAKRKILVNYHGCSKPMGLHRTYPNVINYEGVRGNEYNKFDKDETPQHNVDLVYTRMLAGPMDYTPGAMRNSTQGEFFMNNNNPMSHGTRCHQLGMYVIYYSPMQMLCDAPTAYEQYPDILKFLSEVPADWDETHTIDGKLREYILLARKKGKDWYIGALTDWTERTLEFDLSFIEEGDYSATLYLDGINANKHAEDYQVQQMTLNNTSVLKVCLKSGGGCAILLKRIV